MGGRREGGWWVRGRWEVVREVGERVGGWVGGWVGGGGGELEVLEMEV